jgi:hypothetical protein
MDQEKLPPAGFVPQEILTQLRIDSVEGELPGTTAFSLCYRDAILSTVVIESAGKIAEQVERMAVAFSAAVEERWPGAGENLRPALVRMLVYGTGQVTPVLVPPEPLVIRKPLHVMDQARVDAGPKLHFIETPTVSDPATIPQAATIIIDGPPVEGRNVTIGPPDPVTTAQAAAALEHLDPEETQGQSRPKRGICGAGASAKSAGATGCG